MKKNDFKSEYNRFLKDLLTYESSIDPNKEDWYRENLDKKIFDYVEVHEPGHLKRDDMGNPIKIKLTTREYFNSLGVLDIFLSHKKNKIERMQYSVINAWGFIGYQIGEGKLIDLEYYKPKQILMDINGTKTLVDSYYYYLDNLFWSNGKKESLYKIENKYLFITDTNRWEGYFTGKNNISSFADFKDPRKQDLVINDLIQLYLKQLIQKTEKGIINPKDLIKNNFEINSNTTINITLSGLLAAIHISGIESVTRMFNNKYVHYDELGTSNIEYIERFKNYRFPPYLDLINFLMA
jgi:hypothetical protein